MRVVSAVRNVRIRDGIDVQTIEVAVNTEERMPRLSEAVLIAEEAALKVADGDNIYLPVGNDAVTLGSQCITVMWITANKP